MELDFFSALGLQGFFVSCGRRLQGRLIPVKAAAHPVLPALEEDSGLHAKGNRHVEKKLAVALDPAHRDIALHRADPGLGG